MKLEIYVNLLISPILFQINYLKGVLADCDWFYSKKAFYSKKCMVKI